MQLAYGEMALSPEQLAGLTPFQFEMKLKGFRDGLIRREEDFRNLAWITFCLNADPKNAKKVTKDDIWPNANTVVKAKERNKEAIKHVDSILEKFKKQKGLQ